MCQPGLEKDSGAFAFMKNIVVLISGRGSNFVAIAQACERENWAAEGIRISLVLSNRPDAAGLDRAM